MKQFSPVWNKGFTLLELIIGGAVSLVFLGVSLSLINTQRYQFLSDQNRTSANQNLRVALDLIGADVNLAGQRLQNASSLPGLRVLDGTGVNDAADEHDRLILQRGLVDSRLEVCDATVQFNQRTITVATSSTADTCPYSDADDGDPSTTPARPDAIADSLNEFRNYRCEADGDASCNNTRTVLPRTIADCDDECVVGIIVDNTNPNNNELFYYVYEECVGPNCAAKASGADVDVENIIHVIPLEQDPVNSANNGWIYQYPQGSSIYLLEEKEYRYERAGDTSYDGVINVVINRNDRWKTPAAAINNGLPLQLFNKITGFEIRSNTAVGAGTSTNETSFNPSLTSGQWQDWQDITSLELNIASIGQNSLESLNPQSNQCSPGVFSTDPEGICISSEFLPRNVLSQ